MSPPEEKGAVGSPREWLKRAGSNLEIAKAAPRLKNVYLEDACFEAQQAAEKAIKAVLLDRGIRFPYTHDPRTIGQAAHLTRFAVATRYPGLSEPVSQKEYKRAVKTAETAVKWAQKIIRKAQ